MLNSDFCLLASEAAVELEDLMNGKKSTLEAVKEVAVVLEENLGTSAAEPLKAMPGAFTLVNSAISGSVFDEGVITVSDLLAKVRQIVDRLGNTAPKEKEELNRLREFCAALSLVTSSFLQGAYASRPRHPFRS